MISDDKNGLSQANEMAREIFKMALGCPNITNPIPIVPIFSDEALVKWACLYQWENNPLTNILPKIRDNTSMEISIMSNKQCPKFMISCHENLPYSLGEWVNAKTRITSDPDELLKLLALSPNGTLLHNASQSALLQINGLLYHSIIYRLR